MSPKITLNPGIHVPTLKEKNMMYGLLLEGAMAEEQQNQTQQVNQSARAEEDFWCLGMEAWVSFEIAEAD